MKVTSARVQSALNGTTYPVLLLHGSDAGLVRARAAQAIRLVSGGSPSPFQLSTLVKEDHGRLGEEATAMPLDGTRRIVRVLDAGDGLATSLLRLSATPIKAFIVLEAGELTARSKLRAIAEKAEQWAVVACYPEGETVVLAGLQQRLKQAGIAVGPDALQYLVQELSGDAARREQEVEKLLLYAADTRLIGLADAMACCKAEAELVLPDMFTAAMTGDLPETDRLLAAAEWEAITGPGLLAAFAALLHRLLRLRLLLESGQSQDAAGRAMRPPLYPRQLEASLQSIRLWSSKGLLTLLAAVATADAACKRASTRDFVIASKVVLDAARTASRRSS